MALYLSGHKEADKLLSKDPLALLIAMVLDQQIPLEWAFFGPLNLQQRIGPYDARRIAEMPEDELVAAYVTPPALHRFPASMARRTQAMCRQLVSDYGDPAKLWKTAKTGDELLARVEALPGFGKQKAKIFVALLGKQLGVRPAGWEQAASPFGEAGTYLSIADIDSPEALTLVRQHKREMKAAAKAAAPAAKKAPARTLNAKNAPAAKKAPARTLNAKNAPAAKKAPARSDKAKRAPAAKRVPVGAGATDKVAARV
jgi:uncharacterized HhH-GPD family protein